jgi:hypothetical protein
VPVLRGNHQETGQGLQALREGSRINALRAFMKGGFAAGKPNAKSLRQQAFLLEHRDVTIFYNCAKASLHCRLKPPAAGGLQNWRGRIRGFS